jgi:transposase
LPNTSALVIANADGELIREFQNNAYRVPSFVSFLTRLDVPRDAVILLDNLSVHKHRDVHRVAADKGWHLLYVPPYSPWFNPIEGIFSIVKRAWYAGASLAEAFGRVTPAHSRAFFRNALGLRGPPLR